MAIFQNLEALHSALISVPGWEETPPDALEALETKGLAHDHIRIKGRGALLRVPRFGQFGDDAEANFIYQSTGFERCVASGRTPQLMGTLPLSETLPFGAFIVEEIIGRRPSLPQDMPALANCLAAVHALPMPPEDARAPLADHQDPVEELLRLIERHIKFVEPSGMPAMAREQVMKEMTWARNFLAKVQDTQIKQPQTLVLTDTHPGNFLITAQGAAIAVDLEKTLYGAPAVDIAHASLFTSTTWDPEIGKALTVEEIGAFYRHYLNALRNLGAGDLAQQIRPWLLPMRRLTWLRTTSWFARWTAEIKEKDQTDTVSLSSSPQDLASQNPPASQSAGGPTLRSTDPTVMAAAQDRIAQCFNPRVIANIRMEWLGPGSLKDHF